MLSRKEANQVAFEVCAQIFNRDSKFIIKQLEQIIELTAKAGYFDVVIGSKPDNPLYAMVYNFYNHKPYIVESTLEEAGYSCKRVCGGLKTEW